jgi:hypothetical protein
VIKDLWPFVDNLLNPLLAASFASSLTTASHALSFFVAANKTTAYAKEEDALAS